MEEVLLGVRAQEVHARLWYLCVHDVGQVQRLLHDGHEGLPKIGGNKYVGHGQQAVRAEGLDQQQAVDGLPNGR